MTRLRRIGLIGGMSWESTRLYYAVINEGVRDRLGGLNSADILLHSLNFAPIAEMQFQGRWSQAAELLRGVVKGLEAAGAECIALATNTMHKLAPEIDEATSVPLIHIAEATCAAMTEAGKSRPLLLASRFTMEDDFYLGPIADWGFDVQVPDADGRALVHDTIYNELCKGIVREDSRRAFEEQVKVAAERGCDCVLLGCTEIAMLIGEENSDLPVFDTTAIHAQALVDFAIGD